MENMRWRGPKVKFVMLNPTEVTLGNCYKDWGWGHRWMEIV